MNSDEAFRVSIIIPTYNQWAMLSETLDSVFGQTVQPSEVIVVDDGSTDETAEKFGGDVRLKYIYQTNAGPSAARNTGLAASTGEFILSLDHDDVLHPEYLEHARCAFEQFEAAQIVWTNFAVFGTENYTDYLGMQGTGATIPSLPRHVAEFINARRDSRAILFLTPSESAFLFSHYGGLSNSALVIRRSVLNGWNSKFRIIDDWGMLLNIVATGNCASAFVCTPLWSKRLGSHNLSSLAQRLRMAIADWQVLINEYCPKVAPTAATIYRKFLKDLHLDLGYRLSVEGSLLPAVVEYWRAFGVIPSPKPLWWMMRAIARNVARLWCKAQV
jgi:glycosyltransferase involved in cell wall biosynthesis